MIRSLKESQLKASLNPELVYYISQDDDYEIRKALKNNYVALNKICKEHDKTLFYPSYYTDLLGEKLSKYYLGESIIFGDEITRQYLTEEYKKSHKYPVLAVYNTKEERFLTYAIYMPEQLNAAYLAIVLEDCPEYEKRAKEIDFASPYQSQRNRIDKEREEREKNQGDIKYSLKGCGEDWYGDPFKQKKELDLSKVPDDVLITIAQQMKDELEARGLSSKLLRTELLPHLKSSRLRVSKGYRYEISLPDYSVTIELTPLEKAVYLFFLNHPEGVALKDLADHKDELYKLYKATSGKWNIITLRHTISKLVDPLNNSMNEKCTRIKRSFEAKISPDLARPYIINGKKGEKKFIPFDRSLLEDQ